MTTKQNDLAHGSQKHILDELKMVSDILRAARNKKEVLDLTVRIFQKLGFARVRVWLIHEEKKKFYGGKCSYVPNSKFQKIEGDLRLKQSSPYLTHALHKHEPFINRQNLLLKKYFNDYETTETVEFPLVVSQQVLGSIDIDNGPGQPIQLGKIKKSIAPFVNHIALVLSRVLTEQEIKKANRALKQKINTATNELQKKNEELQYYASHDDLTGLPNRRNLDDELTRQFAKATKRNPIACAMIDVDYLKQINDTKGHPEGDKILQKIAAVLRRQKSIPYVARYAGDEFIMLVPSLVHPNGYRRFERVQRAIYKATGQHVSIGVSDYPAPGVETPVDLIRMADDALYHAKHLGRKKVVCCDDINMRILPAEKRKKKLQHIERHGTVVTDYINQLEILNDISTLLQKATKRSEIMQGVLRIFRSKIGFERVRLHIVDHEKNKLMCAYAVGIAKNMWHTLDRDLKKKNSLTAAVLQHGKIIDVRSPREYKKFNSHIPGLLGTQAALAIPLVAKHKRPMGVLIADYNPDKLHFDTKNHNFFLALGRHIALALDQAQLFSEVHDLNHDLAHKVKEATNKLVHYSQSLEHKIDDNRILHEEEQRTHFEIISALVFSLESKDLYTRGHSTRVANYAYQIGKLIKLSPAELIDLRYGALLHDIGKLSVDQHILHKPTPLTEEEILHLNNHPEIGYKIVSSMHFLHTAATFVRHHHERWDGTGYPLRLQGDGIPLGARIINIADSFDAMTTNRSYGEKLKIADAIIELRAGSATQFDPELIKIIVNALKKKKMSVAK